MNPWLAGARLRTLPAAVVPVAVGTAAAHVASSGGSAGSWSQGVIWWRALAALVVALALQIATNFANDYSDGIRGTDDERRVGPQRLVGSGLVEPTAVKRAAMLAFAVAGVAGAALAFAVGPELFIVGIASMLAGWFYTGGSNPYGYLGLGEVFVFVFFGLVATVGSTYVHIREITGLSVACGVALGLLACALLVTNNLRDIPGDTTAGKKTLAVRLGDQRTRYLYAAMIFGAFVIAAILAAEHRWVTLVVLAILPAWSAVQVVLRGARGKELIPVLAKTGMAQLIYGAAMTVGLWL